MARRKVTLELSPQKNKNETDRWALMYIYKSITRFRWSVCLLTVFNGTKSKEGRALSMKIKWQNSLK